MQLVKDHPHQNGQWQQLHLIIVKCAQYVCVAHIHHWVLHKGQGTTLFTPGILRIPNVAHL